MDSALIQTSLFLAAMVISVPIAKRFGMGAVLGYLIIGALLGPSVIGLLVESESSEGVSHLAEFGVIMMLFMIGLELKPSLLWKLKNSIFVSGTLQVVLSGLATAGIGFALGWTWQISLAIGMIFSLSSTAIVLQTLQEKNALKTSGGEMAFAVLLFQDIAVIPMLALFPLLAPAMAVSETESSGLLQTVKILGAVVLVIVSGRYLVRPVFRAIAFAKLRELFTAFALLIVLTTSVLMHAVGLSPALGAFLAGVVLAESEYRHQLEIDIEPFKGILLGVFFISVGSGIHFGAIVAHPGWVLGGLAVLILVKGLVVFGVGRMAKLSPNDSFLFSFSLAQGGEFAFVLLTLALQQKILEPSLAQALTASVALSMVLAPLIIQAYFKFIEPCYLSLLAPRKADEIDPKDSPVIVAGFGRFGQPIVRILRASGFKPTVLDYDADQVDLISNRFGIKAYYGDASNMDLLRSAGIEKAKLLVLAIDDAEKTTSIVEEVRAHYPHVRILTRAFDRIHAYKLIHRGVKYPFIETAGSSVALAVEALKELGFSSKQALYSGQIFKKHNDASIQHLAKLYHEADESTFISQVKLTMEALEKIMNTDSYSMRDEVDKAWEAAPAKTLPKSPNQ